MKTTPKPKKFPVKERVFRICLNVYDYYVFVVFTTDIKGSRLNRSDRLGYVKADSINPSADGLHTGVPEELISYIFLPYKSDIGVIAHEAFHAVWRLYRATGADHEDRNTDNRAMSVSLRKSTWSTSTMRRSLRNSRRRISISKLPRSSSLAHSSVSSISCMPALRSCILSTSLATDCALPG